MTAGWHKATGAMLAQFADPRAASALSLDLGVDRYALEQQGDREAIVAAVYEALKTRAIRYDKEGYPSGTEVQTIRTGLDVAGSNGGGVGTCLDLALLFAGVCLDNQLAPIVIVTPGHAYAAVCVTESVGDRRRDGRTGLDQQPLDVEYVWELVDAGSYVAVECTGFAWSTLDKTSPAGEGRVDGFLPFDVAVAAGSEQLQTSATDAFGVDIEVAHEAYKPLSLGFEDLQVILTNHGYQLVPKRADAVAAAPTAAPAVETPIDEFPTPVRARVDSVPRVKRYDEIDEIDHLLGRGHVLVGGPPGAGKTYLVKDLAEAGAARDGAVYVAREEHREDLLQEIFQCFFETHGDKRTPNAMADLLADKQAHVFLDECDLSADDLAWVVNRTGGCRYVVAATQPPALDGGVPLPLGRMSEEEGRQLVALELGRDMDEDEQRAATRIVKALEGHAQDIANEARRARRRSGPTLSELADELDGAPEASSEVAARTLQQAPARSLQTAARVKASPHPVPVYMLDGPQAAQLAEEAEDAGLVNANSPSYTLVSSVRDAVAPEVDWLHSAVHDAGVKAESELTPQQIVDDRRFLLWLLEVGADLDQWADVWRLARAIEVHLAVGHTWDAWEEALQWAYQAATHLGDRSGAAWALHQLGTREGARKEPRLAVPLLLDALEMRLELGEIAAAKVTEANLAVLMPPPVVPIETEPAPQQSDPGAAQPVQPGPPLPWPPPVSLLWVVVLCVTVSAPAALTFDPARVEFQDAVPGETVVATVGVANTMPVTMRILLCLEGPASFTGAGLDPCSARDVDAQRSGFSRGPPGIVLAASAYLIPDVTAACRLVDGELLLDPGTGCGLMLDFSSPASGDFSATLRATTPDLELPAVLVGLAARVVDEVGPTAQVVARPEAVVVDPIALGSVTSRSVRFFNQGGAAVTLGPVAVTGEAWSLANPVDGCTGFLLEPGGRPCAVSLRFVAGEGDGDGTLSVGAGDVVVAVPLRGGDAGAAAFAAVADPEVLEPVPLGSQSPQTWTVTNVGSRPGTLGAAAVAGPGWRLATDGCAETELVQGGPPCTVVVVFAPISAVSPALGSLTIPAAGDAAAIVEPLVGTVADMAEISAVPDPATLPPVPPGSVETQTWTMSNIGGAPVTLGTTSATGPGWRVASDGCAGEVLLPGQEACTVTVGFAPDAATPSPALGTLAVSDADGAILLSRPLDGRVGTATLSASPARIDLGPIDPGSSATRSVEIANVGGAATTVRSVTISGVGWRVAADSCTGIVLDPGEPPCTVAVQFRPTAATASPSAGSLRVGADGGVAQAVVGLRGTVATVTALAVEPSTAAAFPATLVDTPSAEVRNVTLRNVGTTPVDFGIGDDPEFPVSGCSARSLDIAEACTLTIGFVPAGRGSRSAVIDLDVAGGPDRQISVSGSGIGPEVDIPSLVFADVPVRADNPEAMVTVTSVGEVAVVLGPIGFLADRSDSGDFLVTSRGTCREEQRLEMGERCTIGIRLRIPAPVGVRKGQLRVTIDGKSRSIPIEATAGPLLEADPPPKLTIDTRPFEEDKLSATDRFELANDGSSTLSISRSFRPGFGPGSWSLSERCSEVVPGGSCTTTATFTAVPEVVGIDTAELTFEILGRSYSVALVGRSLAAIAEIDTEIVTFGGVEVGETKSRRVRVENAGTEALELTTTTIRPVEGAAGAFMSPNDCGVDSLAPGQRCIFDVTFAPPEEGQFAAEFRIGFANDPRGDAYVRLQGRGIL